MANTRHLNFRSFLTERFTAAAVEIFGEVETIVEAFNEENKRLRNILHMVLDPKIKLHKIDLSPHLGAPDVREQPPELNNGEDLEICEPLPETPKEEQIECDISWGSEQQQYVLGEAVNLITTYSVKNDPEVEDSTRPSTTDLYDINVVEVNPNSSPTVSADEAIDEHENWVSSDSDAVTNWSQLSRSEQGTSENRKHDKNPTKKKKAKHARQKTMLELPRMVPNKYLIDAPTDCQTFFTRLNEAFKDFPADKKPVITKVGLTEDVELVDCAFGQVPKGCPLSYQCPMPSGQNYRTHADAPPRPQFPLTYHTLEPLSDAPTLSAKEQEHLKVMSITLDTAHKLEHSTRPTHEHKEFVEILQRLRLTSHFKEICKLKPGRSHAEHLVFKIKKGLRRSKAAQIEREMKAEALQDYCQQLCVNWYPCGLVVHPNAPWLGALPDGLVYDPNERSDFGLVRVKCIDSRSFTDCKFLVCQDGVLQLNKNHSYYWHIQGEMMVAGTSWCDLVVFSREDILVQRIYRDMDIISIMKKKLDDFFFYHYLPSLF